MAILTMALVLTLAAGVASRFLDLERSAAEMAEATMPSLALVEHVRSDVLEHHGLLLAHVLATDPAAMDTLEEAMAVLEADVPTDIDEITAVGVHPEDDVRAAEAKSAWQAYVEAARAVTALSRGSGAAASAGTLLGQAEPVFGVVLAELEVWAAHEEAAAAHELAEVRASIDEALLLIGVGILLTALLLFGAARLAERSVARSTAVSTSLLRSALVLNRFTELSAISDDDEELARLSLNSLAALAGAENGILHLSNASADRARPLASLGDPPTIALTLGDLGRCPGLRTGSVHATEDAGGALSIRCPAYPVDSGRLLCVPLAAHGQAIGTIHLHWSGRGSLEPVVTAAITRAANQAALTIANRQLVRALRGIAATDPKTQLGNARSFDEALHGALRQWRDGDHLAVLMLDIDHFKAFNDRHGHPAGDEALRTVAGIIRSCLRDGDLAARYGGEEFAVLLPSVDATGALAVAERIRARTAATFVSVGPGITDRLTISIGLAEAPAHGLERMALMRAADVALYTAKQRGRNRVVTAAERHERPPDAVGAAGA